MWFLQPCQRCYKSCVNNEVHYLMPVIHTGETPFACTSHPYRARDDGIMLKHIKVVYGRPGEETENALYVVKNVAFSQCLGIHVLLSHVHVRLYWF